MRRAEPESSGSGPSRRSSCRQASASVWSKYGLGQASFGLGSAAWVLAANALVPRMLAGWRRSAAGSLLVPAPGHGRGRRTAGSGHHGLGRVSTRFRSRSRAAGRAVADCHPDPQPRWLTGWRSVGRAGTRLIRLRRICSAQVGGPYPDDGVAGGLDQERSADSGSAAPARAVDRAGGAATGPACLGWTWPR